MKNEEYIQIIKTWENVLDFILCALVGTGRTKTCSK